MGHGPKQTLKADPFVIGACSILLRKSTVGPMSNNGDDVVQDACLRLLELKEPQSIREPDRYARRIARNLFVDAFRRQKRLRALFVETSNPVQIPDDQPGAERILAGKELLGLALAEIDRLPIRCRDAFILHRFENLTYPAIARKMGISTSTVEKHIAEAMARLVLALDFELP